MIQSLFSVVLGEFSRLERSSFYKALLSYYMRDNALCLVRISFLQNFNYNALLESRLSFHVYQLYSQPFWLQPLAFRRTFISLAMVILQARLHCTSASKSLSIGFTMIISYHLLALEYCMHICLICCMILCLQLLVITYRNAKTMR